MSKHAEIPESDRLNPGLVLILANQQREHRNSINKNNDDCQKNLPDTPAHKVDAKIMEDLWSTVIGCKIFSDQIQCDKKGTEIKDTFEELSKTDVGEFRYLVVVIMAEGRLVKVASKKGKNDKTSADVSHQVAIFGSDGMAVLEEEMFAYLLDDSSKWKQKPKLFILQYNKFNSDPLPFEDIALVDRTIKRENTRQPNMVMHEKWRHSCIDFTNSILISARNALLIESTDKIFRKYWQQESVIDMLTRVNGQMNIGETISIYESSMLGPFYLTTSSDNRNEKKVGAAGIGGEIKLTNKGYILIISNTFEDGLRVHEKDANQLVDLWRDTMKCELHGGRSYLTKNCNEMENLLKEVSQMETKLYDYVVVYVGAHGCLKEEIVNSRDGTTTVKKQYIWNEEDMVAERNILSYFKSSKSKWAGKLKIFLFDYCRGNFADECLKTGPIGQVYEVQEEIWPPDMTPILDECIIVYSTSAYHTAIANYLPTAIQRVFRKHWKNTSLTDMLTKVNKKMSEFPGVFQAKSLFKSTATNTDYENENDI